MTDFHLVQFHYPLTIWISSSSSSAMLELISSCYMKTVLFHSLFYFSFSPQQREHAGFLEKIGWCSSSLQKHTRGKRSTCLGSTSDWIELRFLKLSLTSLWKISYDFVSDRQKSKHPYVKTMQVYYDHIQAGQGFSSGSAVKNPPAMQETRQEPWVRSLGQKDLLVKEMATHTSILAWKISWPEPGGLWSMGSQKSQIQFRD